MGSKLNRIVLAFFGLATFVLLVYSLIRIGEFNILEGRYKPTRRVSLDQGGPGPSKEPKQAPPYQALFRIAVSPGISPKKSLAMYTLFAQYLGSALSRKAVLLQRKSYAEVNDLIRRGACDMAFVSSYSYVQGERDYGLEVLAVPQVDGKRTCQSYIIVPAGSTANTLFALRDKRFASSDLLSTTGWLYPAVSLLKGGRDPETFFSDHVITGSHDSSVIAVATGYVDGAAVDSVIYDQMIRTDDSLSRAVKIIERSPELGMPPLVVHPKTDPVLKDQLRAALRHMHEIPSSSPVLAALGCDLFMVPEPSLYDSVRRAAAILDMHR